MFIFMSLIVGWLLFDSLMIVLTDGLKHLGIVIFLVAVGLLIWNLGMAAYRCDQRRMIRTLERTFSTPAVKRL